MRWIIIGCVVVLLAGAGAWGYMVWSAGDAPKSRKVALSQGKAAKKKKVSITRKDSEQRAAATTYDPENEYEEGEILVANPPQGFENSIGSLGFRITERTRLPELDFSVYRLKLPRGTTVKQARRLLAAEYPGISVDANHYFQAQARPEFPKSLPRPLIGWGKAKKACGAGIRLGMIDGAVDVSHPALKGQKIKFKSFHKSGRGPGPKDHGTAVAAIMIGKPEWGGLVPGATLLAGNMFEKKETGKVVGSSIGLIKSIAWMVKSKVHAVNMSVAGADNKIVRAALDKGKEKGLIFVAAAGNWGKKGNKPAYPAAYKRVFAVTALNKKKLVYSHANQGKYIDFAAPGVKIWTAVPGGGRFQSGTSMASPFISVMIAQLRAKGGKSAGALRKKLKGAAVDLGKKGKDKIFGYGLVIQEPKC
ncbi:MAG: S8 family serine peptidase [Rhodospirillales bacterium]|jgi:subtilisin family serine protease|nr:S8 family serine peptidase [Rhodospirillales bacterium]|tara:strand:- start:395 stop:1651 length:1257 start_codon:yes stop_codon:yes gene_type:complete